jgi:hypothetical protein
MLSSASTDLSVRSIAIRSQKGHAPAVDYRDWGHGDFTRPVRRSADAWVDDGDPRPGDPYSHTGEGYQPTSRRRGAHRDDPDQYTPTWALESAAKARADGGRHRDEAEQDRLEADRNGTTELGPDSSATDYWTTPTNWSGTESSTNRRRAAESDDLRGGRHADDADEWAESGEAGHRDDLRRVRERRSRIESARTTSATWADSTSADSTRTDDGTGTDGGWTGGRRRADRRSRDWTDDKPIGGRDELTDTGQWSTAADSQQWSRTAGPGRAERSVDTGRWDQFTDTGVWDGSGWTVRAGISDTDDRADRSNQSDRPGRADRAGQRHGATDTGQWDRLTDTGQWDRATDTGQWDRFTDTGVWDRGELAALDERDRGDGPSWRDRGETFWSGTRLAGDDPRWMETPASAPRSPAVAFPRPPRTRPPGSLPAATTAGRVAVPAERRTSRRMEDDLLDTERGSHLAAVLYTAAWYAVPVLVFFLWLVTLDNSVPPGCVTDVIGGGCDSDRARALASILAAAPRFGAALTSSLVVALLLRWVTGAWRPASLGLASAVVGGGLSTLLYSALTGQPLG